MHLMEFFGEIHLDPENKDTNSIFKTKENEEQFLNEVFWFIIDHDDLHKTEFFALARKIKEKLKNSKGTPSDLWKLWIPMVNKGCIDFYKQKKLQLDPKDVFAKIFRINLAKKLNDHYADDILNDEYNLGM